MFRGIPDPESDDTGTLDFYQIYNSFLAMYQILSSENWTDIVNTALSSEEGVFQIVISAIFFSAWMFFGYCKPCPLRTVNDALDSYYFYASKQSLLETFSLLLSTRSVSFRFQPFSCAG